MATLTNPYKARSWMASATCEVDNMIEKALPRRCTMISLGLIVTGLGIPLLMAVHVLPASFALAFIGFALAVAGSVYGLVMCGEL